MDQIQRLGKGVLLDHVMVTRGTREADGQKQVVDGVCAKTSCGRLDSEQPVFQSLSDHCPVIFDLFDRDEDGSPTSGAPGSPHELGVR